MILRFASLCLVVGSEAQRRTTNGTWEALRWSSPGAVDGAEEALAAWRRTESARCSEVQRVHGETVRRGCAACEARTYRDLWCPRSRCEGVGPRWFGHPQGTLFAGKRGNFLAITLPKAATTALRQWARAAFREEPGTSVDWLFPDSAKPVADRVDGFALWDDVPPAVRARATAFSVVRDPLDRFASGWRELCAYERGPPERRAWGRAVLRRQRFFRDVAKRSGEDAALALFGGGKTGRAPRTFFFNVTAASLVLAQAVRDLACFPDWNEHLTPQTAFLPADFAAASPAVAAHDNLDALLPLAAERAGLNPTTARKFAAIGKNARDGWPQPQDLRPAFDLADRFLSFTVPTRRLWCLVYAPDYAAFPHLFQPPPWCRDDDGPLSE